MIVRPGDTGLLAHTMFYTDEIRQENGVSPAIRRTCRPKELGDGDEIYRGDRRSVPPEEFTDSYRRRATRSDFR